MEMRGGWVVDLDISKFFDSLDHRKLREILDTRVRDGVIRKAIDKWLKAGVMAEGILERPASGTPQGGVISPILANIYLHEVLDSWFEERVKPRLRGRAFMVRYADDAVLVFSDRSEAERVLKALEERCSEYGLRLHPEKTRLVSFRRPPRSPGGGGPDRGSRPGTFDFLGFTHCWARSRRGKWYVRRKTARDRMRRAIKAVNWWCASHRHWRVKVQHRYLSKVIEGHCRYYGITGNSIQIGRFRQEVQRAWRVWLNRRSQRAKLPARGPEGLAGVAESAQPAGEDDMGAVSQALKALSASSCHCLSLGLPSVAKPHFEEPDAVVPHVRICGGPGRATARVYPTPH